MKILYLSIIVLLSISLLLIQFKPIKADNASDILIQNIQVQPTIVKIGDVFTVNATLVNNSSNTVSVEHGACEAPFSITFDNHVHVSENKLNCTSQMVLQRLDPSEKILATSPYLNFIYKAVENGNSSAVATFSYLKWDPATQSNSEKTISKPFSFTIYDNNTNTQIPHHGGPPFTFQKLSPLKQFKSGVSIQSINCDSYYTLVIKAQDGSPACLKFKTAKILIERGWSTDPFIAIMEPHYGGIAGANWTGSYVIDVNMERQNTVTPMLFQIFYPNGTQYKTDSISSSDVQPDGFYKYPITIHVSSSSNQPIDREFKVQITYENETKIIHLPSLCCDIPTNSKMRQQDAMSTFMPCDTPYPQSNTGIAVLYMPANSTGKLCVDYSNPNPPRSTDVRIFEAQHLSEDTKDIRVLPSQDNIPQGNSTIVYTLKTSKIGFYGLTFFCYGTPLAVGYDNQSRIVANDFPWLGQTFFCPMQTYTFHISGLSGIEVKYLPYP